LRVDPVRRDAMFGKRINFWLHEKLLSILSEL
jgi:hypothetical protein